MVRLHNNEWVWSCHVTLVGVVSHMAIVGAVRSHDNDGCGWVHHMTMWVWSGHMIMMGVVSTSHDSGYTHNKWVG